MYKEICSQAYFIKGDDDDDAALHDFARVHGPASATEEELREAQGEGSESVAAQEKITLTAALDVAHTHLRSVFTLKEKY